MSRSTLPKSRTEGKGKAASSSTPAVSHEIVPGRLNDQEWNLMVDHDGGDEFAMDIMEEICAMAMDKIYGDYIQRQLVPYTVAQAKDAILQIIEWQFLARDPGEPANTNSDPGWLEDEEPAPGVTDCWAQGSVPTQKASSARASVIREEEEDEEPVCTDLNGQASDLEASGLTSSGELVSDQTAGEPAQGGAVEASDAVIEDITGTPVPEDRLTTTEQSQPQAETLDHSQPQEETETTAQPQTKNQPTRTDSPRLQPTPPPQKSKSKFKPYTGRLKSPAVAKMTESLEDTEIKMLQQSAERTVPDDVRPDPDKLLMPASCHSIIRLQAGRPPGTNDALFDESGNVISIYRLDPEKLPNHKVRTGYKIIDPAAEAAQARLKAMRTGKYVSDKTAPRSADGRPSESRHGDSTPTQTVTTMYSKHSGMHRHSKPYDMVPLPPPLLETVSLAPGVVIREGDQVRTGPQTSAKTRSAATQSGHKKLSPVCIKASLPTLTVAELLEHQTPVVKPMADNIPIPPIPQHAE